MEDGRANDTLAQAIDKFRHGFIPNGDANDIILQMRTWEHHDVGGTPGFGGDTERALRSIRTPVLYMPSATDLYFPLEDARYEAAFISKVDLRPIPSLWGHTAGAASNPADSRFLNAAVVGFLSLQDEVAPRGDLGLAPHRLEVGASGRAA